MAESPDSTDCAICGSPLDEHDLDRGTCHECRAPKGTIGELDIAIRAWGADPARISDWPVIRHLLRKRFGNDRANVKLWEECTDWLRAEGRLTPNDYLPLPLKYLQWLLEHGFTQCEQVGNGGDLVERLLVGPDGAELSLHELALLAAYLQQPIAQFERDGKSDAARQRNKLKLIRDYNYSLQMSGKTRQRETDQAPAAAKNQQVIEAIERKTPELDTESVDWLAACKKNEKKLGLQLATLRTYRLVSNGGRKMPDEMFGMDRDGRLWRRKGTPKSGVYYFVPSLPKASIEASN